VTPPSPTTAGRGAGTWWPGHLWLITMTVHLTYGASRLLLSYRVLDLGGDAFELGVVIALGSLAPLVVVVPIGRLLDERHPTGPLLVGALIATAGMVAVAVAPSLGVVGVASMLLGLGQLLSMMASQSFVPKYADEARFDRHFGSLTLAASTGQTLGLPLVALLSHLSGGASSGAGSAVPALWTMAAISLLVLPSTGWLIAMRSRFGTPARADLPAATPIRELLGLRGMPAAMLSSMAVLASMDLLTGYLPLLGESRGWTVSTVSLLLSVRAFASMASRLVLNRILAVTPRDWLILSATGVSGLAMALMPWLSSVGATVGAMVVIGFFWGVGQPLTMTWVVAISPPRDRSAALSLRLAGNRVGQVAVPTALGVAAAHTGIGAVFLVSGLLLGGATATARRSLTRAAEDRSQA